jgi:Ca-activated chloride channel homolog
MRRVWIVVALAGLGLVVSGCGGGSSSGTSDAKSGGGQAVAPGEPAPAGTNTNSDAQQYRADENPTSTFALDVDTASYGYAQERLDAGQLPDPSTVRPEEFVNAFRQDYPEPDGNGFTVTADGARLPGDDGTRLLRIGLQTRGESPETRRDAALTFVIDTSGSMGDTGKLDLVKDALHDLVSQLRPTDRVAIVAFSDEPHVLRSMTPASNQAALDDAIDELSADGSTNLGAGMQTGYKVARAGYRDGATNRVVLLSDGLANQGETSAKAILSTVSDEAGKGISMLGVGVGSDYGDALMEQLADHGNGMVVYVSSRAEARRVFIEDLPANLDVRARDAKAQVRFDSDTVDSYRLIGFDDRRLSSDDFRDDSVGGGWIGPGHSVTALYEVRLAPGATGHLATAAVRWHDPSTGEAAETSQQIAVPDLAPSLSGAAPRLRADHAAAYFAELLRGENVPGVTLASLADEADAAAGATEDSDLTELARLIRVAAGLR